MKFVGFELSEEMHAAMKRRCQEEGVTMATFMRAAIGDHLAREPWKPITREQHYLKRSDAI